MSLFDFPVTDVFQLPPESIQSVFLCIVYTFPTFLLPVTPVTALQEETTALYVQHHKLK